MSEYSVQEILNDIKDLPWGEFVTKYHGNNKNQIRKLIYSQIGENAIDIPEAELVDMTVVHTNGTEETLQVPFDSIDFRSEIKMVKFKKGKRVFKVEDKKEVGVRAKIEEIDHESGYTIISCTIADKRQKDKRLKLRKGYIDITQEKMRKNPVELPKED